MGSTPIASTEFFSGPSGPLLFGGVTWGWSGGPCRAHDVERRYAQRNAPLSTVQRLDRTNTVIYLHYKMRLSPAARQDMKAFWAWLEAREQWFYNDLPMVEAVQWFYSLIGDVYVVENIASFADETAWGAYRAALAHRKRDDDWERERVSQDEWWDFLETKMLTDPPVNIGFSRQG